LNGYLSLLAWLGLGKDQSRSDFPFREDDGKVSGHEVRHDCSSDLWLTSIPYAFWSALNWLFWNAVSLTLLGIPPTSRERMW
jgi:hypothetical protein